MNRSSMIVKEPAKVQIVVFTVSRKEIRRRNRLFWLRKALPGAFELILKAMALAAAIVMLLCMATTDSPSYEAVIKVYLIALCVLSACGALWQIFYDR